MKLSEKDFKEVVRGYKSSIEFVEKDVFEEQHNIEFDHEPSKLAIQRMEHEVREFLDKLSEDDIELWLSEKDLDSLGIYLYFTQSGCGTGFWDMTNYFDEDFTIKLTAFAGSNENLYLYLNSKGQYDLD